MEQQPRDESRAATVRKGGDESWTEAGELIDRPENLPTAAGSREPSGDVPPGGGAAATGHTPTTSTTTTPRRSTSRSAGTAATSATPTSSSSAGTGPGSRVESQSPGGADFSSSAAPAGVGSNTPVGGEPDRFRNWDSGQAEPGTHDTGMDMMPSLSAVGGMAATAAVGGLTYFWWRRRQARNTRAARMRAMLFDLSASAGGELPRMIGQAAAQSKSAWLPLLLLPIGLWLRERGKDGERASDELLKPLNLEKRSERLARQGADLLDSYRRPRSRRSIRIMAVAGG